MVLFDYQYFTGHGRVVTALPRRKPARDSALVSLRGVKSPFLHPETLSRATTGRRGEPFGRAPRRRPCCSRRRPFIPAAVPSTWTDGTGLGGFWKGSPFPTGPNTCLGKQPYPFSSLRYPLFVSLFALIADALGNLVPETARIRDNWKKSRCAVPEKGQIRDGSEKKPAVGQEMDCFRDDAGPKPRFGQEKAYFRDNG